MTDPNYTALLIVLDRSGSMSPIRDDMVGGLEHMLADQAAHPGMLTVDLITFDTEIEHTHSFAAPSDVKVLLEPRGGTALYDAVGLSINGFGAALTALPEHARPSVVQVIIVTDGFENSSHEYRLDTVRALIKQQTEKYGWEFVFLGESGCGAHRPRTRHLRRRRHDLRGRFRCGAVDARQHEREAPRLSLARAPRVH